MIPTASFTYIVKPNRVVQFTDASTNTPTSWLWTFKKADGSGTPTTDNTQNPEITFTDVDVYLVTLQSTNADGSSEYSETMVIRDAVGITATIFDQIKGEMPNGFVYTVPGIYNTIRTWQLMLMDAAGVLEADVFNEAKWSALYCTLVAKLVVRDQVLAAAKQTMTATQTGGSKGGLKKIETGPSNAEWYDISQVTSSIVKSGELTTQISDDCCSIASKLGVRLGFCKKSKTVYPFEVVKKPEE
jgi:PKD repeat protein